MAQEPSADARGFSPRPGPWQSDPSNGSVSLGEGNVTGNTTQSMDGDEQSPYNYMIIVHLVAVMFALCGLLGNGTVIWLLGFRVRRNPFSVYILNLAVADFLYLLSCIIVIPLYVINYTHYVDVFIPPVFFTSYLAGLSLLMAISTERCVSALFPIWYRCHRPAHLSAIVCAVIWGLSLCLQTPRFVCIYYVDFSCDNVDFIYIVTSCLTLLVLCVSGLTLLLRVHCCSWRRQTAKLYRVILLTVLAFLVLDVSCNLGYLLLGLFSSFSTFHRYMPIFDILSILNSGVNPVIYFFVGRQGGAPERADGGHVAEQVGAPVLRQTCCPPGHGEGQLCRDIGI